MDFGFSCKLLNMYNEFWLPKALSMKFMWIPNPSDRQEKILYFAFMHHICIQTKWDYMLYLGF